MSIELEEVEKKQKTLKKVAKIGGLAYASELDMSVQAQETGERMRMPKKKVEGRSGKRSEGRQREEKWSAKSNSIHGPRHWIDFCNWIIKERMHCLWKIKERIDWDSIQSRLFVIITPLFFWCMFCLHFYFSFLHLCLLLSLQTPRTKTPLPWQLQLWPLFLLTSWPCKPFW